VLEKILSGSGGITGCAGLPDAMRQGCGIDKTAINCPFLRCSAIHVRTVASAVWRPASEANVPKLFVRREYG
jgi:hypothetical protein